MLNKSKKFTTAVNYKYDQLLKWKTFVSYVPMNSTIHGISSINSIFFTLRFELVYEGLARA